jgi:hypothetical protein
LIDGLQPDDLETAHKVLQALNVAHDPLLVALRNAELDDEPVSEAEREATERARADVVEGRTLSEEDVRRKLRSA